MSSSNYNLLLTPSIITASNKEATSVKLTKSNAIDQILIDITIKVVLHKK